MDGWTQPQASPEVGPGKEVGRCSTRRWMCPGVTPTGQRGAELSSTAGKGNLGICEAQDSPLRAAGHPVAAPAPSSRCCGTSWPRSAAQNPVTCSCQGAQGVPAVLSSVPAFPLKGALFCQISGPFLGWNTVPSSCVAELFTEQPTSCSTHTGAGLVLRGLSPRGLLRGQTPVCPRFAALYLQLR